MSRPRWRPRSWHSWWRAGWIPMAVLATLVQLGVFWALSSRRAGLRPPRPVSRQAFLDASGDPGWNEWLWLRTPAILFQPSTRNFSGTAWLAARPMHLEIARLTVRTRPLPYPIAAALGSLPPLLPRVDQGLAGSWSVPPSGLAVPTVGPVPLPKTSRLRIVEGLAGWKVPEVLELPAVPAQAIPAPTVLRLAVNPAGQVAVPPLVWRSSGVAALDAAAARSVEGLQFEPASKVAEPATNPGGLSWGQVEVEWMPGPPAQSLAVRTP